MKLKDAMKIIDKHEGGFMVHFEKREGGCLHSDHFPDKHAGEDLFEDIETAWEYAKRFAKATSKDTYVNIYVIDHDFTPVAGYVNRRLKTYRTLS